ncbi:major outer membrane protein [Campylobacter jejuni]|uniref:major outer membrane protein n=1 Tax=Campylobacter jejuni TaxID=197 RepID=UPI003DA61BCF
MKLVKLSLVAALAAGAFSAANATPLEEAIKDIDVSGVLRYRYENKIINTEHKLTSAVLYQTTLKLSFNLTTTHKMVVMGSSIIFNLYK